MKLETLRHSMINRIYKNRFDQSEINNYISTASKNKFTSYRYKNKPDFVPLIQPRGGVPTYCRQLELYKKLYNAGCDIFPLTIDSHTRHNDYNTSARMLELSEETGTDYLNGYPLIDHGYLITRKLHDDFDIPVSLRHGTPDARLLVEIALASGIFDIEGGPITYVLPYSKKFPLDKAFHYWKYVDEICVMYSSLNEPVNRESFGAMTSTLVPPCITIAIEILEMLFSLESGIKSFSVGFSQTGSIVQDIVTANVLRRLANEYKSVFGYQDSDICL